ncbi:hypothetical protein [Erwinia phage vB_Ea277G]|nr:hypothetical protein [Erwinia phage vB_Ea277G]
MAIIRKLKNQNIWDTDKECIMITVNCVGAMGAGIAKDCRDNYPELYEKYRKWCRAGMFKIGMLYSERMSDGKIILLFPTKVDWKAPSKMEWVEQGLIKLRDTYDQRGLFDIAMTMPGCGNGWLKHWEVYPMIQRILGPTDLEIDVHHPYEVDGE